MERLNSAKLDVETPSHLPEKIELGCGNTKIDGAWGVDHIKTGEADQVFDLDRERWPLPSNHFTWIRAKDVYEHLENPINFMEEVQRIAKSGATVIIQGPHFSSGNWHDPTHKRLLGSRSMDNFTENADFQFYSDTKFEIKNVEIRFAPFRIQPHKHIGYFISNKWTQIYEETLLSSLLPARDIRFTLEVVE